ncbi:MAG: NAD(P)/FAD-dependent oxidoreductase [Bacilli bacterium]|nr:NAD(P)/FAD-dependent oxidoreductase [Bacilli bacterium]
MKEFDVIIIGAGPAGIACAKILSQEKINYCIIDKDTFPRKKLCGGALTKKSIELLEDLNINIDKIIKTKFNNVVIDTKNKSYILNYSKKISMVDRTEFDNYNLDIIKKDNKNIFEDEKVIGIEENILITSKNKYKYKYVVFADGVNGYSRKISKLSNIGFCVELDVDKNNEKDLIISFNAISDGYAWIFPKGKYTTIGLGKFKNIKDDYKQKLKEFCLTKNIAIDSDEIKGYPISNGNYIKKSVFDENKIIVGDAAGLVDPISGEGIYYSLLSGKYAGEVICEKIKKEDLILSKRYNRKIKHVHNKLRRNRIISALFYSKLNHFLLKIALSNRFLKKIAEKLVLS